MFKRSIFIRQPSILSKSLKTSNSQPSKLTYSKLLPSSSSTEDITPSFGTLSESNLSILLRAEKLKAKIIKIILKSNWGNQDIISLGSISIFSESNKHIPILFCSTLPFCEKSNNLSILFNQQLVKSNSNNVWYHPWNNNEVCLNILIPNNEKINFIRIWNNTNIGDSCTKEIDIKDSDGKTFLGEIPLGFGIDAYLTYPINNNSHFPNINSIFSNLELNKKVSDSYGFYPLIYTERIKFEFLSNFIGNDTFGINAIHIYDSENKLIPSSLIKEINLFNAHTKDNYQHLFEDEETVKRTSKTSQYIFKHEDNQFPILEIIFKEKIQIIKILFWNLNSRNFNLKFGIKKLKLYNNDKFIWIGNLKPGNGRKRKILETITTIWFSDLPNFRI